MAEEWTKVTAKSGRRRHTRPSSPPPATQKTSDSPAPDDPDSTPSCRTTGPFLSVEEITRQHESLQTQWETSTSREALIALLDKQFAAATSDAPITIHDAICLGAGTFDPADGSWQAKRSAHLQVLAFETMVSHLGRCLTSSLARLLHSGLHANPRTRIPPRYQNQTHYTGANPHTQR